MKKEVYEVTIYEDGSEEWRQNGKLHRIDGKPAAIYSNGDQYWL